MLQPCFGLSLSLQGGSLDTKDMTLHSLLEYIVFAFDQILTQEGPIACPDVAWEIIYHMIEKCPRGPSLIKQVFGVEQSTFMKLMSKAKILFVALYELCMLLKQNCSQWKVKEYNCQIGKVWKILTCFEPKSRGDANKYQPIRSLKDAVQRRNI